MIAGDKGSGKEILKPSNLCYSLFVALNCGALLENFLESELMGYEEGAFTGAKRGGKAGMLELADKETNFLDEINQLTLSMQTSLLRVIQEKQVLRLGRDGLIPIHTRIITATNESLEKKSFARSF